MVLGSISDYSNAGYLRSQKAIVGRKTIVKPDVVAPGQYFIVPASATAPSYNPRTGGQILYTGGKYRLFNGTSAATPYMAGVAALLLEKQPDLKLAQVRDLLARHATQDTHTGKCPNHAWGYGKLDLAAVKNMISALKK
jgi:subtilisin family serine protease